MTRTRYFQITYCLNDERHTFVQSDTHMHPADAWYYACLHSGIGLSYGQNHDQQNDAALRRHAQAKGLTDVSWVKLPD
ncbi:DUF6555 family protein [Pseudomonas sp. C9]|jgi:hypothetical protein|uniref:DUF6555 family protein n=1 Tax=Pseudomonas sp. C9 TaxID=1311337 RepID=UPI000985558B|nr:DUF6555 family protein [Pseudomonas sp. C9]OOG10834.1 hypothetical protein BMS17_01615 [Pseudomonas sp. C9]